MTYPRTARALREVLAARGVRPTRRHGQHFLTDPQAVDAIVRDAGVTAADRVVEVGTGVGLLTHALCETGAEIVTFEVDERMLEIARELGDWPLRVTFVAGDVLARKHDLSDAFRAALAVRPRPPGRLLLVSNLPYGAGTPIVLDVLALEHPPDALVVMLQEEVVEKLLATPGRGDYGAPSVAVALKARGRLLRRFGPEVFWPRPRVRSAVVELVPREDRPLAPDEHRPFDAFVTALFSHRRKVLASALRMAVEGLTAEAARAHLEAQGLSPTVRVGEVAPEALLVLWRHARP
jgi:16S rRNA (adenine1518-N6/adenine1519-N6)-dimethyltransferase